MSFPIIRIERFLLSLSIIVTLFIRIERCAHKACPYRRGFFVQIVANLIIKLGNTHLESSLGRIKRIKKHYFDNNDKLVKSVCV